MVQRPHRDRADFAQVVVDRDQVNAFARQRVEVDRQGRRQRLAFAGLHLGDAPVVEHHAADHLHVEGPHLQRPLGRLADDRKGFRQQRVQGGVADDALLVPFQFVPRFAAPLALGVHDFGDPLLELDRFGLQSVIGQLFHFRLRAH